jgi:hypothetical protein
MCILWKMQKDTSLQFHLSLSKCDRVLFILYTYVFRGKLTKFFYLNLNLKIWTHMCRCFIFVHYFLQDFVICSVGYLLLILFFVKLKNTKTYLS